MNRFFKAAVLFISLLILYTGCSTKKNTALNRFYHSLTTKYNILFNGSESFKAGIKKYEESYMDDYSQILPVFTYGDDELSASIKPDMDRTIEKSTKSIKMHSITKKPEQKKGPMSDKDKAFYSKNEYNRYIDDAYLIMGKAFFYQEDYEAAMRIFDFITKQYDEPKTKYLAYNWLIRVNVQLKDFREAQNIIEFIQGEIEYPEKLDYSLKLTLADFYLKQQHFAEAETNISEALTLVRKKKEKLRLTFILAQLKEELGKPNEASELFEEVIKMNPSYEMSFNAKIKRATLFSGKGNSAKIRSDLLEMLEDKKNDEYKDQIYFALGELEMKNNQIAKAVEYYKLSASSSIKNTNQKALSYLALANIHFDQSKYIEAQSYFDSAVVSLDRNFPGYDELALKNRYLSKLVTNLRVVSHQDSLQKVAGMPEKDRKAFIQKIIQDLQAREAQEKLEEQQQLMAERGGYDNLGRTRQVNPQAESGKWYFYSPTAKSFGMPEFKRLWGARKLEDNWRRRNKQVIGIEQISETEFSDDIIDPKKGLDNKTPEYYMVELPLTDSAIAESHLKIQRALYNVGEVYRNNLKDYPLAVDSYKELIERYPESEYKIPSYYSLYKAYIEQGDMAQAEIYKNMIVRNYPESKYAKVLTDPNYFKQFEQEEKQRKEYYAATLDIYRQGNYNEVITRCEQMIPKEKDTEYYSKYRYLKALAMGDLYGITILKNEMEGIKNDFPKEDPVSISAENLLLAIQENELKNLNNLQIAQKSDTLISRKEIAGIVEQKTLEEIEKIYTYTPESVHYFLLVIGKEADINQLKFNLINFNLDYDIQKSYEVVSKEFNKFFNVVEVKEFENESKGQDYLSKIKAGTDVVFKDVKSEDYQYFIITPGNIEKLNEEKVIRDYLLFYQKNYKQ